MITSTNDNQKKRKDGGLSVGKDSELDSIFRSRAREVFGEDDESEKSATQDALELWLAWRGDPAYLIALLGNRPGREAMWQVVRYTQIPELSEKYSQVEARSLGERFPDHVLAYMVQFVIKETNLSPGAEVFAEGSEESTPFPQTYKINADESFKHLKAERIVSARWPRVNLPFGGNF